MPSKRRSMEHVPCTECQRLPKDHTIKTADVCRAYKL
jgi:hypothetical protein